MTTSPPESIVLRTARLELRAAVAETARADADGQRERLSTLLNARIPRAWPPELMADHLEQFAELLEKDPAQVGWGAWYVVGDDPAGGERTVVGIVGCGKPNDEAAVQIGYAILDEFQRCGYASEAVKCLIDWLFEHDEVESIIADTYPDLRPSIRVMEKNGMTHQGSGTENGTIRYLLARP